MQQEHEGDISLPREEEQQSTTGRASLNGRSQDPPEGDEEGDIGYGGADSDSNPEEQEKVGEQHEASTAKEQEEAVDDGNGNSEIVGQVLRENEDRRADEADEDAVSLEKTLDIGSSDGNKDLDTADLAASVNDDNQHERLPPQRFEVEQSPQFAQIKGSDYRDGIQPSTSNRSLDYHGHAGSGESSRQVSETEDAGLDFVDINLGPAKISSPLASGSSPYGPGAHFASRSAVEIRQDSMSSNSAKARELALHAQRMERANSQQLEWQSEDDEDAQREKSLDVQNSVHEGEPQSDTTPTILPIKPPAGITLTFANEEGELATVVSPVTERFSDGRTSMQEVYGMAEEKGTDVDLKAKESNESSKKVESGATEPKAAQEVDNTISSASSEAATGTNGSTIVTSPSISVHEETAQSPTLTDAADRKSEGKKKGGATHKPSALEQHLSRTRMTTLPPKPKVEDVKHLHDYEAMMKLSREMEKKKQQEEEEQKIKRDLSLQERIKVWEKEILPSWTRARRETRLRKLWHKGVPPNLRPRVWALACGNSQMLPRNLFSKANSEARESLRDGTFPALDLEAIEVDIEQTLPTLRLFQKETGALYDDLFQILCAFTIVRLDQLKSQESEANKSATSYDRHGSLRNDSKATEAPVETTKAVYPMGASSLAAMLLINLSPSETLIALVNLIAEKPWLRALYSLSATDESRQSLTLQRRASHSVSSNRDGLSASITPSSKLRASLSTTAHRPYDSTSALAGFERVFDTLLADQMPKVYANMQARGVRPSAYVNHWIRTMFVPYLPFDAVARLWDCILLDESDAMLFRTGIALVSLLSARLYVPDKDELVSILHGNNRGAIAVWTRIRSNGVEGTLSDSNSRPSREHAHGHDDAQEQTKSDKQDDAKDGDETVDSPQGNANAPRESTIFAPDELVPLDDIYGGQYGIKERQVFDALEEQESWWKDSVLERLLDREIVS